MVCPLPASGGEEVEQDVGTDAGNAQGLRYFPLLTG
jgi:hypothetical protein